MEMGNGGNVPGVTDQSTWEETAHVEGKPGSGGRVIRSR